MFLNAPAGSEKAAIAALLAGADSVYLGFDDLDHQRPQCKNLSRDQLLRVQRRAEQGGQRLWVTFNSSCEEGQFAAMTQRARWLQDHGVHGVIVADLGLLRAIHSQAPGLRKLFSVQGQCANVPMAKLVKSLGADRVVLDRDTTIEEARAIREQVGIEVELFAFGYMCNARDSVCYMGDHWSGSPCNVHCSQPARFIDGDSRIAAKHPDSRGDRWFFMKFYSALKYLPAMLDAPIDAVKIEGRHRSADFVGASTAVFRAAIDAARKCASTGAPYRLDPAWVERLRQLAFEFEVTDGRYVDGDYKRKVDGAPSHANMLRFAQSAWDNAMDGGGPLLALQQLTTAARRHLAPAPTDRTDTRRGPLP